MTAVLRPLNVADKHMTIMEETTKRGMTKPVSQANLQTRLLGVKLSKMGLAEGKVDVKKEGKWNQGRKRNEEEWNIGRDEERKY